MELHARKYDLATFNCINTVSSIIPNPSLYTGADGALLRFRDLPTALAGAEHTFRPPWFHRT